MSDTLRLATSSDWSEQLRDAIRSTDELAAELGLEPRELPVAEAAQGAFPLLVPRAFAARMRRGDRNDPLLRQVLVAAEEERSVAGFDTDPVGELSRYADEPGLLQKYSGRALLIATGHCAINCRYCFRRHYPYGEQALTRGERLARIDELVEDESIGEIILSGGDPLLLADRELAAIARRIAGAPRPITLRVHTRLPVVIPDRITAGLLAALATEELRSVVVLHSNHAQEIDTNTAAAIRRMREAGITVLNQAVLLAGVNDDPHTLARLSDALFAAGALPYYLHQLDPVAGAAHFAVDDARARRIAGELAELRPGYLVPRLTREVAGAGSKRILAPLYADSGKCGEGDA
jgi:EF-P beta-lysylation protein EpmB